MSAALTQFPLPSDVFRISVEKYHEMIRAGALTADDPVELLEGVLVFKTPKDEPHNASVDLLNDELRRLAPDGWSSRNQGSLTLPDGEPEPDAALVRGDRRHYVRLGRKPGPADTALVVEVADASLRRDRTAKLRSYARAGIAVYWIVNLADRTIEVHSEPDPQAQPEPLYKSRVVVNAGGSVPVVVENRVVAELKVADVLP